MKPTPFRDYVDRAAEGRNSLPRIVLGSALIILVWIALTAAVLVGGLALDVWIQEDPRGVGIDSMADTGSGSFLSSSLGIAVTLLSLGSLWPATWLALAVVHRRRFATVLGRAYRLPVAEFTRAALVTAVVLIAFSMLWLPLDWPSRTGLDVGAWLLAAVPLLLVVLLQTSAEELAFRGYLQQALAHQFRSPLIWAAVPALLFTLLHLSSELSVAMNGAVLVQIAAFAAVMALLVVRTGSLAASMGAHFGNNVLAILVLSSSAGTEATALLKGRPIEDPTWTGPELVALTLSGIVAYALIWVLLTARWSPVRLRVSTAGAGPV